MCSPMLHDPLFCFLQVPLLKCRQINFPVSVLETQFGGIEFKRSFTVLPVDSVLRNFGDFGKFLGPGWSLAGRFGPGVDFGAAG